MSQSRLPENEKYGARLREERTRVEPHQGRFSAKIGVNQNRQSSLEAGSRELRADYLELVAGTGIDVGYVLTGRRSGESLAIDESQLLEAFRRLGTDARGALLVIARQLAAGGMVQAQALHAPKESYRAADRPDLD